LRTIYPAGLELISASWIARITTSAQLYFFLYKLLVSFGHFL
jgi:hypothetical protein